MKGILYILMGCIMLFAGCSSNSCADNGNISFANAKKMLEDNSEIVLIDVKTKEEFNEGHIKGAINISIDEIDKVIETYKNDYDTILYCRSGSRASSALKYLKEKDYKEVYNAGGLLDYSDEFGKLVE